MMPRQVPGGIVRRYWCDYPRCPVPFHETVWCPQQMREMAAVAEVPLAPEKAAALREWREERRQQRGVAEAEQARLLQAAGSPQREHYWLLIAIPLALLGIVVVLGLLGVR